MLSVVSKACTFLAVRRLSDTYHRCLAIIICLGTFDQVEAQGVSATADSYAPKFTHCPSDRPFLREAGATFYTNQTLCGGESEYIRGRQIAVADLWKTYLATGGARKTGYSGKILGDFPIVALAHSGGGLRASLHGAGVVHALDGRTKSSSVRGILQLLTYHSGLGGGSWLLMSLASNGYPPIPDLLGTWEFEKDILKPGGLNFIEDTRYLAALVDDAKKKDQAGWNVTITDPWGRALAYHFLPGTKATDFYKSSSPKAHGAGILFSEIRNSKAFRSHQAPYPIIVADNQPLTSDTKPQVSSVKGSEVISFATTVFEFTPDEFGSFDPYLAYFVPMKHLGTYAYSGQPYIPRKVLEQHPNGNSSGQCAVAFDQSSFIMGTSATDFNKEGVAKLWKTSPLLRALAQALPKDHEKIDTARYPNPFRGMNGPSGFDSTDLSELHLVDGGGNGENLPLNPFLVPARQVDVILAADATADTTESSQNGANWPNGTSLINSYIRATQVLPQGSLPMPPMPTDPWEWSSKGFDTRPVFFGCDTPENATGNGGYPLIVYMPSSPLPEASRMFLTNTSTYKTSYTRKDTAAFLASASATVSDPIVNSQHDKQWHTCLACALLERSRSRQNIAISSACELCFRRYCYRNGLTRRKRPSKLNSSSSLVVTFPTTIFIAFMATIGFFVW